MALDDLGLVPTIKKYVATIAEYNDTSIEFVSFGEDKRLPQEYEVALFRLVQESIQNAVKHADAYLIKVKLDIDDIKLIIVLFDKGNGFNYELVCYNTYDSN